MMQLKRSSCLLVGMTVVVVPLVCFGAWVWIRTRPYTEMVYPATLVNSDDCSEVGRVFLNHLLRNDIDHAKAVVVPEQWMKLEAWADGRDGFLQCTTTLDNDVDGVFSATGESQGAITRTFSGTYTCAEEEYVFSVDHVVLEKFADGCKVTAWTVSETVGW
ncbi:MAG: hypothetical protein R3E79_02375 [Caldilineaceae bacterium]